MKRPGFRTLATDPAAAARPRSLMLTLLCVVAGCATPALRDGPPADPDRAAAAAEPVPKAEPRSRYGNPASYKVHGRRYYTLTDSEGFTERGVASWYGRKFHGRRTSSGETYDMYRMTAAHKRLPLPTYVEVTNLDNGRKAIVKVNDRGPFHGNRIIDLSYAAAVKIGIAEAGTGLVEIRALSPGGGAQPRLAAAAGSREGSSEKAQGQPRVAAASGVAAGGNGNVAAAASPGQARSALTKMYLQVGAFDDFENAARLRDRVRAAVGSVVDIATAPGGAPPRYRVQVGPVASVDGADAMVEAVEALGIVDHHFVTD